MNPGEQQTHKRKVDSLSIQLEELAKAFDAEMTDFKIEMGNRIGEAVGAERAHRLKLAEEQRSYVDAQDRELRGAILALRDAKWHQRWRWLLTGRWW